MSNYFPKKKYQIDRTGRNPDNLVLDEHRIVEPAYRVVIPHHAAFFKDSLVIQYRGRILELGRDYQVADLFKDATEKSGSSVYHQIVFINNDINGDVYLRYQTYGDDDYASSIARYMQSISFDSRDVQWENVFNKPLVYPSTYHGHHVDDLRGIGPIITALQNIERAIQNLRARNNLKFMTILHEHYSKLNARFDALRTIANRQLEIETMLGDFRGEMEEMIAVTRRNIEMIGNDWDTRIDAIEAKLVEFGENFNSRYVKVSDFSWDNLANRPYVPQRTVNKLSDNFEFVVNFAGNDTHGSNTMGQNKIIFSSKDARMSVETNFNREKKTNDIAMLSDLVWGTIRDKPLVPTFQHVSTATRNGSRITIPVNPSPNAVWVTTSDFHIDIDEKAKTMRVSNSLNGIPWSEEFLFKRHLDATRDQITNLKYVSPYQDTGIVSPVPANATRERDLTAVLKEYKLNSTPKRTTGGLIVSSNEDSAMVLDYLNRTVKFRLGLSTETNLEDREVAFKDWVEEEVVQPIGCIMLWSNSGELPDTKWLRCDGQKHYIRDYPELYRVIGERYLTDMEMDRTEWFQTPYLSLLGITRDSDVCYIIRAR